MKTDKLIKYMAAVLAVALSPLAQATQVPGVAAQPDSFFYTGKPYDADLGAYTFAYRTYDPQVNRWTSADPSGFPDGANNSQYAPVPTVQIDMDGLRAFLAFNGGVQSITYNVGFYDSTGSITQQQIGNWASAVQSAWQFTGTDRSNGDPLTMNTSVTFSLISGAFSLNDALNQYDNVVMFEQLGNNRSYVSNFRVGHFDYDITSNQLVHEAGHFMLAPDEYHDVGGRSVPIKGWENTIMGQANQSNATKLDANLVLMSLSGQPHLFE